MTAIWTWNRELWTNAGLIGGTETWTTVTDFAIPPDEDLQRFVYRTAGSLQAYAEFDNPVPAPATGHQYTGISVRYGDVGDREYVYEGHHPWQWGGGWINSITLGGTIYWTGITPPVTVDMELRRSNAPEEGHQLHLEVREYMQFDSLGGPTTSTLLPGSRYETSFQYLTSKLIE